MTLTIAICNLCRSECVDDVRVFGKAISRYVRCTGCGAEQATGTFGQECIDEWNANAIDPENTDDDA